MVGQGDFMTADEVAFKQKGKKVCVPSPLASHFSVCTAKSAAACLQGWPASSFTSGNRRSRGPADCTAVVQAGGCHAVLAACSLQTWMLVQGRV